MKNITICLLVVLCTVFLLSCGSTTKDIISESADKSCQVKISGSRMTSLDPFKVEIVATGNGLSNTLMAEIMSSDLTSENVSISWSDNSNCTITFTERDGTKKGTGVAFSKDKILLQPL